MTMAGKLARPTRLERWGACRRHVWLRLEAALERWQQRRRLLALNDDMLKDIGLSRCDVEGEAARRWR